MQKRSIIGIAVALVIIAMIIMASWTPMPAEASPESPQDRALVHALERQAKAQEDQAAELRAISRSLAEISRKIGR